MDNLHTSNRLLSVSMWFNLVMSKLKVPLTFKNALCIVKLRKCVLVVIVRHYSAVIGVVCLIVLHYNNYFRCFTKMK